MPYLAGMLTAEQALEVMPAVLVLEFCYRSHVQDQDWQTAYFPLCS